MADHFGGGNPVIKRAGFGIYILQCCIVLKIYMYQPWLDMNYMDTYNVCNYIHKPMRRI